MEYMYYVGPKARLQGVEMMTKIQQPFIPAKQVDLYTKTEND